MRTTLVLAVLASVSFTVGTALAGETINLTPPLYREQARETQKVRPVRDMNTTPQPVVVPLLVETTGSINVVSEAEQPSAR